MINLISLVLLFPYWLLWHCQWDNLAVVGSGTNYYECGGNNVLLHGQQYLVPTRVVLQCSTICYRSDRLGFARWRTESHCLMPLEQASDPSLLKLKYLDEPTPSFLWCNEWTFHCIQLFSWSVKWKVACVITIVLMYGPCLLWAYSGQRKLASCGRQTSSPLLRLLTAFCLRCGKTRIS